MNNQTKSETILLIEDNKNILDNLTEYFEMADYNIISANNGKEGIYLAETFLPDLIICDALMIPMDGYEVLKVLLNTAKTASIPFIFSTSMSETVDRSTALKLGADDYIIKPFEPEALLTMAKKWLNKANKKSDLVS